MIATLNKHPFEVNEDEESRPFWSWVCEGKWEPHTFVLFDRFLKPDMTYVDLGAWIGPTVLYASRLAQRVIAVEPDPVALERLKWNIVANNLHVELFEGAIAGYDGFLDLGSGWLGASTTRANPAAGGGMSAWAEGHTVRVPCRTLSNFLAEETGAPLFIKCDVEGSEEQILETDFSFFATHKPDLYLSLHPFWWRNEPKVWNLVERLISLYAHALDAHTLRPLTPLHRPREIFLTECDPTLS